MATPADNVSEQLHETIDTLSPERQRRLLALIRSFEDDGDPDDIDPVESLKAGLRDVKAGRVYPIDTLWERVKAD